MPDTFRTGDGTPIYFEVHGSGPPLYVCHGGPSATFSYMKEALEPLARSFTLVYHDYRGSGRSGRAPSPTYRFQQLADDLDALRAHLGHRRIGLLAHSLGGFVALHYALRYGQHLQALVLVATTPTGSTGRLLVPTLRALGPRRLVRLVAAAAAYGLTWAWRRESPARRRAWHRLLALLQEGRPDRMERVRAAERAAAVASDNAPNLEAEAYRTDLTSRLHEIRCPTLVACGDRDAVFYAALALYRRHWSAATYRIFHGVGHHPAIEEPEAFFPAVEGFLREQWRGMQVSG
ncbi:MAG: alpha/beta hydrolase [Bacillota bacterium]